MSNKVLHIFGVMNRGGAELRTLALMPQMQALGYEFHFCVLSGQPGTLDEEILALGGKIHYLKIGPGFLWQFMALLKQQQIDILHTHVALVSGLLVLLGTMAGVKKRISHLRSTLDERHLSFLRRCRNAVLRRSLYRFSTHVLGVCRGALKCQWKDWQQRPKCRVIYNGLPLTDMSHEADFWSQWIPGYRRQRVIINLARMHPAKNHLRLLSVFNAFLRQYGEGFLVLVGKEDKQIKAQIENYAAQNGITERVVILSEQSQPLRFLAHADAMLFPSLWEGLPGSVLEAASVGTPVLASAIPGCTEISQQLQAVQTESLNSDDRIWAEKLATLIQQAENRPALINNFRESDFLLDKNLRALHAVYAE
ncbi:glycosyltransferase [Lacimicrobium alkaliphilum]|uniref:Glycosyltransferase EpsF n=1 Tax=Lacimicrobium alkaliphilum TaxID=1526571 RepID=A0ABQ1R1L4_9ALTE|nr:glycosyltransferase [Lacimicrobium alkaliphilum]GGD54124.1 putative glycosyltransferase EpsF [Lacimicrobium alkaliphilum]